MDEVKIKALLLSLLYFVCGVFGIMFYFVCGVFGIMFLFLIMLYFVCCLQ